MTPKKNKFSIEEIKKSEKLYYWNIEDDFYDQLSQPLTTNQAPTQASPPSSTGTNSVCSDPMKHLSQIRMHKGSKRQAAEADLLACKGQLSRHCLTWLRRANVSEPEVELCLTAVRRYPVDGTTKVLLHLLRRQEITIREKTIDLLGEQELSGKERNQLQRYLRAETIPVLRNKLQNLMAP